MIVTTNPATGKQLTSFHLHDDAYVDAALSAAAKAQKTWRRIPVGKRAELLRGMAKTLRAGKSRYAEVITREMGKPIVESEAEIEKCAYNCDFYAEHAAAYLTDEPVPSNATESIVAFEPLGVVLAIMPWNYPFWQFFRFAAPAFAAGNGAILKHANNVPQCALAIEEIMKEAGCPEGLFATLLIEASKVASIIADDRIAAVTLTGSTEVGAIVASQAGKALKKQVLELGGSDPFIVLGDADLEEAATVAVKARYINVGQSCVNAKRFIVEESIADRFVELFCAGVETLKVGDPMERDTNIGPMARENLMTGLHAQVEKTLAAGAVLKAGGQPLDRSGFFYPPTVLDHVRPDMVAFCEETFGPAAAIIRVKDADEAIRLANQTEYGLGSAIWTRDVARARQFAREIDAGAVFINGMVASDPRYPFGGIKRSGYGRELGVYGIREFVNIKTVWIGPAKAAAPTPTAPEQGRARMAQPAILRPKELKTNDRGGGARTTPLVTRTCGSSSMINGITAFDPGAAIGLHKHNCEESVLVIEGQAIAEIDGVQHHLDTNDTTWIPANVPHRFINPTDKPMRIFWTYASIDATRTMIATGETRAIDAEHGKASA